MTKKITVLIGVLLFLAPSWGSPLQAQDWSPEQRGVLTALEELWHYSGALDFDPWFQRVSDDYHGWGITDEAPRGKDGWLEEAHGRLERPLRVHHQILPRAIDIHGEVAIIYYHYAALFRSDEGAFTLSKGQWTDTFRRNGSGWLLIADSGGETDSHPDILVSSEWLDRRRGDPNLVILQVESRADRYTEGHIPGALPLSYGQITWAGDTEEGSELLPLDDIEATLEELGVSDTDQIVVYSSHPLLATRLWFTLDLMGVGRTISLLDGGLAAWNDEGRPLSTEAPGPQTPGTLTLNPRPEIVVDHEWVQANSEAPGIALVDARYQPEYTGEDQEGESVGHIPGAGNAVWEEMVQSREVFRFIAVEEMATKLAAAGVDPGETVVPYCIVGLRASLDYYVARLLGFETLLYDGSWRDWTQRGLPLVEGPGGGGS